MYCSLEETISFESIDISSDRTLSGKMYFQGIIKVTNNSILTIEPGTELIFNSAVPSALVIDQGSRINAVGTPELPITFTSNKQTIGAWGGIVILGRADVITDQPTIPTDTRFIPDFAYGGSNNTDNSGELRYVRILYTGGLSSENHEVPSVFNGLTLCGVGNNTVIDYVQVHKSGRDAFALFGGTVNLRHIIATSSRDDGLYGNESWIGNVQFYVAQMTNRTIGNGVELENQRNSEFITKLESSNPPCYDFRKPKFTNVTIIGKDGDSDSPNHAVYYKQGAHGYFDNLVTVGFEESKPIKIEAEGYTTYLWVHFASFQLFGLKNPEDIEEPDTLFSEKTLMTDNNYFNEITTNGS